MYGEDWDGGNGGGWRGGGKRGGWGWEGEVVGGEGKEGGGAECADVGLLGWEARVALFEDFQFVMGREGREGSLFFNICH